MTQCAKLPYRTRAIAIADSRFSRFLMHVMRMVQLEHPAESVRKSFAFTRRDLSTSTPPPRAQTHANLA
jgi:hypothetical protein